MGERIEARHRQISSKNQRSKRNEKTKEGGVQLGLFLFAKFTRDIMRKIKLRRLMIMSTKAIIGLVLGLVSTVGLGTTIGVLCHKHLKNKSVGQVATEE